MLLPIVTHYTHQTPAEAVSVAENALALRASPHQGLQGVSRF